MGGDRMRRDIERQGPGRDDAYEPDRVEQICHAALALEPASRVSFVAEACGGDEWLRAEVESLLRHQSKVDRFLDEPALLTAAQRIAGESEHALIGRQIGAYHIQSLLGAGGMGEVYRARDSALRRDVAIKVLPRLFVAEPDRLTRFMREARVLAALNHPHIGAIYGLEHVDGVPALVLELAEGETLAARLKKGPITPAEALMIARQIADALEAAHERGVVHRDLKPANVMIAPDGTAKVLDFGLATMAAGNDAHAESTPPQSSLTTIGSHAGAVLGTPAYMSPEQAVGAVADRRSDLWAFGVVLLEMLTGRPVFAGETAEQLLAAVLNHDPDWTRLPASTPPAVRRLLQRCLQRDRKRRLDSAAAARLEIDDGLTSPGGEGPDAGSVVRLHGWSRWHKAWVAAGVLASIAVGGAAVAYIGRRQATYVEHFAIPVNDEVSQLAISADGAMLAFVMPDVDTGRHVLHVQPIGAPRATALAGTEGARFPFWSPDNAYVGFFTNHKLMKVRPSGGAAQPIVAVNGTARGASWGSRNVIVYSQRAGGPLWRVNADGTGAAPLTDTLLTPDEQSHRWPVFLPDGDRFLFWGGNFSKDGTRSGIYLSSLSMRQKIFVVAARSNPGFALDGKLFYVDAAGQLVMHAFDSNSGRLVSDVRVVSAAVGFQAALYWGAFTVSATGTVVINPSTAISQSILTWYDRSGNELGTVGRPGLMFNPSLSPDGQRVAVDISDAKTSNVDVWVIDLEGDTAARFTFDPVEEATPVWAPDGGRIAYQSSDTGTKMKVTSGFGDGRVVAQRPSVTLTTGNNNFPNSWSRDGASLLAMVEGVGLEDAHLALFRIGDPRPTRLWTTNSNQTNGQISPDGNWLAYASDDESGQSAVYVTTFPGAVGRWQVSVGGGSEPRWRGDGQELFYLDSGNAVTAVTIRTGTAVSFSSGPPRRLFRARVRPRLSNSDLFSYDVTKDGSRFIVNRYVPPSSVAPLDILLNATAAEAPSSSVSPAAR
jgi:Tol biopolymer transport system component